MNKRSSAEQKSKSANRFIFLLLHCCAIALFPVFFGCAGTGKPALSAATHAMAADYNLNGIEASDKGDYDKALAYFSEALKINRSVENTEGIAANLINIAVIEQKKGNIPNAHQSIDEILSLPDVNDTFKSEAAFEKARIYLREKEISKAREWIAKSLNFSKGNREGSRWNLLSRAAMMESKYDEAIVAATTALKLNRSNQQGTEEANSLRILGESKAEKGDFKESKEFYLKALEIDKESGESRKIALTLKGLGNLMLKQELFQEAISYYKRAYDVSKNSGDTGGTAEAVGLLAGAHKKAGDDKTAEELLRQKNKLEKKVDDK